VFRLDFGGFAEFKGVGLHAGFTGCAGEEIGVAA
jgi:hypothetical protein